jgi:hypothetical protein
MDGIILKNLNLCSKIVLCGSGFNKRLLPSLLLLVPPKGCWFGFKSHKNLNPSDLSLQNLEPANIMENYLHCTIVIVFSIGDREVHSLVLCLLGIVVHQTYFISSLWGSTTLHSKQLSVHWCMCCANRNPELGGA